MLENWGTRVWLLAEGTFLHCQSIQTGFESQQTCSIGTWSTQPWCKWRVDHSPPSSAKSKNEWKYTTTLPYSLTACTKTLYCYHPNTNHTSMFWVNIFVQHLLPKETEKHTYPLDILEIWLRFHIWFQLLLLIAHVHPFVFHYVLGKKKKKIFKFQKPSSLYSYKIYCRKIIMFLKNSMVWQSWMLNWALQKLQPLIKPKPGPEEKLWGRRKPVDTRMQPTCPLLHWMQHTHKHITKHSALIFQKLDNLH